MDIVSNILGMTAYAMLVSLIMPARIHIFIGCLGWLIGWAIYEQYIKPKRPTDV